VSLIPLILVLLLPAQGEEDGRIQNLIEQLGSDSPEHRDSALRGILGLGTRCRPALQQAMGNKDPEMAGRARIAMRWLDTAEQLTPHLVQIAPEVVIRLAKDELDGWANEFLSWSANPIPGGPQSADRKDLETLALHALLVTRDPKKCIRICEGVSSLGLCSVAPSVIRLHAGSPYADVRSAAAKTLGSLSCPEALKYLRDCIRGSRPEVSVLVALREAGDKDSIPDLIRCAYSEQPEIASHALTAATALGGQDALGETAIARSKEESPFARCRSAFILGTLGRPQDLPILIRLLKDPENKVLQAALRALSFLPAPQDPGEIALLACASDREIAELAARTLLNWGARSSASILASNLKKASESSLIWPLWCLVELDARDEARQLGVLLREEDPRRRRHVLWALGRLKARSEAPGILNVLAKGE
jgi:hypothetical protein